MRLGLQELKLLPNALSSDKDVIVIFLLLAPL